MSNNNFEGPVKSSFEGHTPGPWKYDDGHVFIEDKNREWNSIATVYDIYKNDGTAEFNAPLITKAYLIPELIDNLVMALNVMAANGIAVDIIDLFLKKVNE